MNLASRVLFGVAVGYSEWGDWEMAGQKLQLGTAALQNASEAQLDLQQNDVSKQLSVET